MQDDVDVRLYAARAWIRHRVKDAVEQRYGLCQDVAVDPAGELRLLVRFPGEARDRPIALEPVPDGEFISPVHPKARYRPLTDRDREYLAAGDRKRRDL